MVERLKFLSSWAWGFLRPLVIALLSDQGRKLAEAAREAVELMEITELDGDTKRRHAVEMIKTYLSNFGIAVRTSIINAAIEAALLELRSKSN
jgi:hypothetical protein